MPSIFVESRKPWRNILLGGRNIKLGERCLSVYGFMCGYKMQITKEDTWKTLYMEHRHYHLIYMYEGKRIIWNTYDFEDYGQALKLYLNIEI